MDARTAAERFRTAAEARHVDGMVAALHPQVVCKSPVVFGRYEGADTVAQLLRAVSETFEDFRYVGELGGDDVHGLLFEARVGDRELEGIDLIRAAPDGRVAELTVMVRPMSGVIALAEAMAPKVEGLAKAAR
jgi:hypothetical protein